MATDQQLKADLHRLAPATDAADAWRALQRRIRRRRGRNIAVSALTVVLAAAGISAALVATGGRDRASQEVVTGSPSEGSADTEVASPDGASESLTPWPATYEEGGRTVVPLTFPDGTTAELSYPSELALLQAYADGVNAYILNNPLPVEYGLLELTQVRAWDPVDSLVIGKAIAASLSLDIDIGHLRHSIRQLSYPVAVDRNTETSLHLDLVALGHRDLAHVVAEPRDAKATGLVGACRRA